MLANSHRALVEEAVVAAPIGWTSERERTRGRAHQGIAVAYQNLTGITPYAVVRSLAWDAPTRGSPSPGEVVLAEPPDGTGHLPRRRTLMLVVGIATLLALRRHG